ncbi:MAG: hypothetical protein HRT52_07795 [Colwellia sp.]|nr:hypothetical protein [Colwellia sp.]
MAQFLFLALISLTWIAQAKSTEVLSVDRSVTNNINLFFPNERNIKPKAGDFEIINYVLMSNEVGERWGVITLTNLSNGSRELDQDHLLALFADGSRQPPLEYKLNFKGKETQSITVSFGQSKFPILSIHSSN